MREGEAGMNAIEGVPGQRSSKTCRSGEEFGVYPKRNEKPLNHFKQDCEMFTVGT